MKKYMLTTMIITLLLVFSSPLSAGIKKGPYLQQLTRTSTLIVFETDSNTNGTVEWGSSESLGNSAAAIPGNMHEVLLDGLVPGSYYFYKVISDGDTSEIYRFRAAPNPDQSFKFVAYGDSRSGDAEHRRVVTSMLQEDIGLYINSGDLVPTGSDRDAWNRHFDIERDLTSTAFQLPSMGNHDTEGLTADNYKEFFVMPENGMGEYEENFYYTDYGNSRFICLDTEIASLSMGGIQYEWLLQLLQEAKDDPYMLHIFIFMHQGPYSAKPGRTGNATLRAMNDMLADYNVTVMISGHDHYYYRGTSPKSATSDKSLPFIVTGGGGAGLYDCEPRPDYGVINIEWEKVHNYVVFEVNGENLTVSAKYADGSLIETFNWKSAKTEVPFETVDGDTEEPVDEPGDKVSAIINSVEGGELSTEDENATLTIPAGALDEDTEISIEPMPRADYPDSDKLASLIYELTPKDLVFNSPASLSIVIAGNINSNATYFLASLSGDSWNIIENSQTNNDSVTANIDQLGTYVIYMEVEDSEPVIDGDDSDPTDTGASATYDPENGFSGCSQISGYTSSVFVLLLLALAVLRKTKRNNN